jgi:hypothetical protein
MEYDRLNAAHIPNVDHRVGVEEDEVRQLADGDAAGLVLAAQEPGRLENVFAKLGVHARRSIVAKFQ